MPRKTKETEKIEIEEEIKPVKKRTKKEVTTNKSSKIDKNLETEADLEKKSKTKKTSVSKSATKKDVSKSVSSKSTATNKKNSKSDVVDLDKVKNSTTKKDSTSKKASTVKKKTTSKKKTTVKKSAKKLEPEVFIMEYYDLPYRYNQTVVKILAQTPKILFVYWDISDKDRTNFMNHFGEEFFYRTKPVLIVRNETMNYSFELEINDFANSWYININDANCKYVVELGRRPYLHDSYINTNYIYVSSSNQIDAPNNHILFEKFNPNVVYKNTKTNTFVEKDFSHLIGYIRNILNEKDHPMYAFYKKLYDENLLEDLVKPDFANPSSLPSSTFK